MIGVGLAVGCAAPPEPSLRAPARVALAEAAARGKPVMIVFTATWCAPCKTMAEEWARPEIAPLLARSFTVVRLYGLEKDRTGNPGARDEFMAMSGGGQGVPFWVLRRPDGRLLADSTGRSVKPLPDPSGMTSRGHLLRILKLYGAKVTDVEIARARDAE